LTATQNAAPIIDSALKLADLGFKVFPIRPLGKAPAFEGWQQAATTDTIQIHKWWAENPKYNVGIATGDVNDIVVVDFDSEEAVDWWDEQWLADGTRVSTASGGLHIYYRTEAADIQTNVGVLHPAIDIRASGGLVVGPGSVTPNGIYQGDLTDVPFAEEAVLALLPVRRKFDTTPYEGDKVDAATDYERHMVSLVEKKLRDLPREWFEGAHWDVEIFKAACWLSRMVNSGAYALDEDSALTILLTESPTDERWGNEMILTKWESAKLQTIGQYAELPPELALDLPDYGDVLTSIPAGSPLESLVFGVDAIEDETQARGFRFKLLVEAERSGLFDTSAIVALAQGNPAIKGQAFSVTSTLKALEAAQDALASEVTESLEPPAESASEPQEAVRVTILDDNERATVLAGRTGLDEYLDWVGTNVHTVNTPYHRFCWWQMLGIVFGDTAFIPLPGGKNMGLNTYGIAMGESSTGKTQAQDFRDFILTAVYHNDPTFNLHSDASSQALQAALVERDGKVSWINSDEAAGVFSEWLNRDWSTDFVDRLTLYYEGKVPAVLRVGNKDISGKSASTTLSMSFFGTPERLWKVLTRDMFMTGFLARFVWEESDPKVKVKGANRKRIRRGEEAKGGDPRVHEYAEEYIFVKNYMRTVHFAQQVPMDFTDEVLDRIEMAIDTMVDSLEGTRNWEIIDPSVRRLGDTVMKLAAGLAVSECSAVVQMRHILHVLLQAEFFVNNLVKMASNISASSFQMECDMVENFVKGKSGSAKKEVVYSHFRQWDSVQLDKVLLALMKQGRLRENHVKNKQLVYIEVVK
jgi:hypothetical protein